MLLSVILKHRRSLDSSLIRNLAPETVSHMLFSCDRACKTWLLSPFRLRPEVTNSAKLDVLWSIFGNTWKGQDVWSNLGLFASICWQIWKSRNEWVFRNVWVVETRIIATAIEEFHEFCLANSHTKQATSVGYEASTSRSTK